MADRFSPSLLNFLKATFDGFDTDHDGKLTREDIGNMMRFSSGQTPTDDQIQYHFKEFDTDENDVVDFPEYLTMVAKLARGRDKNRVVKSFQCLDKDGDGFLTRQDLKQTLEETKIDEMMKYDHDQDGKLSLEEFTQWVKDNKILGELFCVAPGTN